MEAREGLEINGYSSMKVGLHASSQSEPRTTSEESPYETDSEILER